MLRRRRWVAAQAEPPERQQRDAEPMVDGPHLGGDLGGDRGGAVPLRARGVARQRRLDRAGPGARLRLARLPARPAAARVLAREERGQARRHRRARHPALQLRLIEHPQHQHVERGGEAMKVVVVPDRVGQPIEVVRRAERLGDLLVQAVAHVLGRGVERQKDRGALERRLVGPPDALPRGAAQEARPVGLARHDEAGGGGEDARDLRRRHRLDLDLRRRRIAGLGDVDAGLGAQPGKQRLEIAAVRGELGRAQVNPDRHLVAQQSLEPFPALEREGELEKVLGEVAVGARHPARQRRRREPHAGDARPGSGRQRASGEHGERREHDASEKAQPHALGASAAVLDERRDRAHPVVEAAGGGVARLGQPVDTRAARGVGGGVDRLDQRPGRCRFRGTPGRRRGPGGRSRPRSATRGGGRCSARGRPRVPGRARSTRGSR